MSYGKELLFEAYNCNDNIKSMEVVYKFLKDLPNKIDMEMLFNPFVHCYEDPIDPLLNGITGVVGLSTSHCAFHSYGWMPCGDYKNVTFVDLFSCKDFDDDFVVEEFKRIFGGELIFKCQSPKRGIYFDYKY